MDEIIFGAGEVYLYEFNGAEIPNHVTIETEEHNVGHCLGGFSVEYKPEVYDVKNQYGNIVRRFLKSEDITAKTGVLSWDLEKLSLLSAAKFNKDESTKKLTFGGGKNLKSVLLRFVHTKENGKKLRFTMIGQAGNGFVIEFADKELVLDAEIAAIEKKKGFLAEIEEEIGE